MRLKIEFNRWRTAADIKVLESEPLYAGSMYVHKIIVEANLYENENLRASFKDKRSGEMLAANIPLLFGSRGDGALKQYEALLPTKLLKSPKELLMSIGLFTSNSSGELVQILVTAPISVSIEGGGEYFENHMSEDEQTQYDAHLSEVLSAVNDVADKIDGFCVGDITVVTGPPDTSAEASAQIKTDSNNLLKLNMSFKIPKGAQGQKGEDGKDGTDGITPDIGITATVDNTSGNPRVEITKGGTAANPVYDFAFKGITGRLGAVPSVSISASVVGADDGVVVTKDGTDENPAFNFEFNIIPLVCNTIMQIYSPLSEGKTITAIIAKSVFNRTPIVGDTLTMNCKRTVQGKSQVFIAAATVTAVTTDSQNVSIILNIDTSAELNSANWRVEIGGNHKMNGSMASLDVWCSAVKSQAAISENTQIIVFPPACYIRYVGERLNKAFSLGIQDVCVASSGAYTGQISAKLANDCGCSYALVGHSETRHYSGVTDGDCKAKIKQCLSNGLTAILCVGGDEESDEETVIAQQLSAALLADTEIETAITQGKLIIAYEPVWTMGTGAVISIPHINSVCIFLQEWLAENFGTGALKTKIWYAGVVNEENIGAIMQSDKLSGVLTSGASLNAARFATMNNLFI